jgi:hypothetical protein
VQLIMGACRVQDREDAPCLDALCLSGLCLSGLRLSWACLS